MVINASINGSPRQAGNNSSEQSKGNELKARCGNALSRLKSVQRNILSQPEYRMFRDLFLVIEDTVKILQETIQEKNNG